MTTTNDKGQEDVLQDKGRAIPIISDRSLDDFEQNNNGEVALPPELSDYEYLRITKEKPIPVNEPVIKIGDKGIAARGNITGISAQVKSGKTALCSVAIAGAISKDGKIDGFNDLHVEPNTEGKAVINGDTEQAADDQQYNLNTILKRADYDHTPDFFLSYNLRQLSRSEYQKTLNAICEGAARRFNGIHLITIDGGADFCQCGPNDEKEAIEIVEYFIHLSIKYDCPVIIVIHQNPGSDKERGHFGSEIQRKCYGLLSISKTGDVSTAQVKVGRKAGTTDTPLIHYKYDTSKGYHVEVGAPDTDEDKRDTEMKKHKEVADKVFSGQKSFTYTKAVSEIMRVTKRKERTAKEMIKNMTGWGYITKGDDGIYRQNNG